MPTAGGIAAKFGDRYEGRWTVLQLFRVLREEEDWIRVEVPGVDEAEFAVGRGDTVEFHQVKRQRAEGPWTITALTKVLLGFQRRLADPQAQCTFVSAESAKELNEICERAPKAESIEEFDKAMATSQQISLAARQLRDVFNLDQIAELWPLARRIAVEQVGEAQLMRLLKNESRQLVAAPPETVIGFVGDFLADSLSRTLHAHEIWQQISRQGWRRAELGRDSTTLAAIEKQNDRVRRNLEGLTIGGQFFVPEEAAAVLELLRDPNGPKAVLISGPGGAGKSGVLRETFNRLSEEGWPLLALRADWFPPSQSSAQLVAGLGIPASPAIVLAAQPASRQRLLILDQLDAVSVVSGRRTGLLVALEELFEELGDVDGVRVLMACRQFDLEADRRLRKLATDPRLDVESVPVAAWDAERVRHILDSLGLPLPAQASLIKVLETPLHLAIYVEIAGQRSEVASRVATSADLFKAYWDLKEQEVREAVGYPGHWLEVLETISDAIDLERVLWVPTDLLDRYRTDASAMISAGVLRQNDDRISFFHEAFFDYVFARLFATRNDHLLDYLLSRDQDLFRRSQVRQVLQYLRSTRPEPFRSELAELLGSEQIRFHLKVLMVDLLGQISDPRPEEWTTLVELIETGQAELRARLLGLLRTKPQWFLMSVDSGLVAEWLNSPDSNRQDRITDVLYGQQHNLPEVVAVLLRRHAGRDEGWVRRLRFIVQGADLTLDRTFFEFVLELIDEGVLDGLSGGLALNSDFWSLGYGLSDKKPEWAAELCVHHLTRQRELARAIGRSNPFDPELGLMPDSQLGPPILRSAASGGARVLASGLVPLMLDLSTENRADDGYHDVIWRYRFDEPVFSITDAVRAATEQALTRWAVSPSPGFDPLLNRIRAVRSATADHLLLAAYAGVGPDFANDAVTALLEDSARRLNLLEVARDVVANVTPHCSDKRLGELENAILSYRSAFERKNPIPGRWGESQFRLLSVVARDRLSTLGKQRLSELERKFGRIAESADIAVITGGRVQSPIAEEAATHMSDKDWIRAMQKHRGPMKFDAAHPLKGGAEQLAYLFRAQFKGQPERFVQLTAKLPDGLNIYYYRAALWATIEITERVSVDMVWTVFRRYQASTDSEVQRCLARLAQQASGSEIPDDALAVVVRIATEADDPDHDVWRDKDARSGHFVHLGDVDMAAVNSTRGAGVYAVAAALKANPTLATRLAVPLNRIASDPVFAVRAAAASVVLALLGTDDDRAVDLFQRMLNGAPDQLLGSHGIVSCLDHLLRTRPAVVLPNVKKMLSSSDDQTSSAGGRLAAVAWLLGLEKTELWLGAGTAGRAGAVGILARQVRYPEFSERCAPHLRGAFYDPEQTVREAAVQAFWDLDPADLEALESLCMDFLASPSSAESLGHLLHVVDQSRALLPRLVQALARRLLAAGEKLADIRYGESADSATVAGLVIRIYSATTDRAEQDKDLDLVDELLKLGAHGVENSLVEFER